MREVATAFWRKPWARFKLAVAGRKLELLKDLLPPGGRILDVGAGNGAFAKRLMGGGFDVRALDVVDRGVIPGLEIEVFDGSTLPFDEQSFDVVQFITVLHHARDPESLVREAARVGRRVVIMEDIYDSAWRKYLTYAADSLVNLEFFGHPHNNKTDAGWRRLFEETGLKVESVKYVRFLGLFIQVVYVLIRREAVSGPGCVEGLKRAEI